MNIIVSLLSFCLFFTDCLGQLPEYNVTYTDMVEPMREFAVAQSLFLLSNGTDIKVTANKLVSIMNTKYGNGWFYLVGTDTGFNGLTPEKNTTLQFRFKENKVTISQLVQVHNCNNSSLKNLEEIIKQARISPVIEKDKVNQTINEDIITKAKTMLNSTLGYCVNTTTIGQQEDCFWQMSSNLYDLIHMSGKKIVSNVGLDGHFFSFGDPSAYVFKIGELFFSIRVI